MTRTRLTALLAGSAMLALAGAANAGGFSRGNADTDIIYEDGNFNMRAGVTVVSPSRKFSQHGNPALVGTDHAGTYIVPSFAWKVNVVDNLRCVGTHVMNNGGTAEYAFPTLSGKIEEKFDTFESALTCGVKFEAGKGNFWLLGGGFIEKFDYLRENVVPIPGAPNAILDLESQEYGYRIGAAYEIPEIALRAQLMYRSGTEHHDANGTLTFLGTPLPAFGTGDLPQSVELKLQSGIAPGWLAFGSVKWMDWSVTEQLIVTAPALGITQTNDYFWRDGWTVTAGVGHAFTETVSGLAAITWDRGVATGWDLSSDTWTLAVGGSVKDSIGGELRGGVGVTYLTSAAENQYPTGQNAAADAGYALAASVGYSIKW